MFYSSVTKTLFAVALCSAVLVPSAVMGQEKENMAKIAEFGGAMHAMAEECGSYSAEQLKEMKAGQQSASSAGGLSSAEFDTIFAKGYEETKAKIAAGSTRQKQTMCEQMKKMQN